MKKLLSLTCILFISIAGYAQEKSGWRDVSLSFESRALALMKQLTLDEKISFLQYTQPAVKRLGISSYNWWNEALHGVARNGIATVFPQAIGMAASWDPDLIKKMGDAVSTEARAKYNDALHKNDSNAIYQGLTFWSPNINIFRDPRWGRGQETYGEDPFLTSQIGIAYVKGLQGYDSRYLKVAATAKHFAVHSGPESSRHSFDAKVSEKDLYETYLPAFEALVKQAKVEGIMCAYNRLEGAPCCANAKLLQQILRDKWHFRGHVVTDCWAISDMVGFHKTYADAVEAATASLQAGSDLSCGPEMGSLKLALQKDPSLLKNIDTALYRLLLTRFKLGMFDPAANVSFSKIGIDQNDSKQNRLLAKQLARESMVLLKNDAHALPLKKNISTIAVIGPYANDKEVLLGNYNGIPSVSVSFFEGIRAKVSNSTSILYAGGTLTAEKKYTTAQEKQDSLTNALSVASKADAVIIVAGISSKVEGEEGDVKTSIDGFYKGDRTTLDLPQDQQQLIKAIHATGKKIILVLTAGSALGLDWENENIPAIVQAWYPGEEAGTALADILFGDYDPAGRLPVSFYHSVNDLPAFDDYNMAGRTYRYFNGKLLYPFGHGLSFTDFKYESLSINKSTLKKNDSVIVTVKIKNTGSYNGDEVVQLYIKTPSTLKQAPLKSLQGFKRIFIPKNKTATIHFAISAAQLRFFDESANDYKIATGKYELQIGSSSADTRLSRIFSVE